jgi:hypothetical protein
VFGGQATSSLLSSAAVDETEFCRSQPGCFGFSLQGNILKSRCNDSGEICMGLRGLSDRRGENVSRSLQSWL